MPDEPHPSCTACADPAQRQPPAYYEAHYQAMAKSALLAGLGDYQALREQIGKIVQ
jgi:hypothetical protein